MIKKICYLVILFVGFFLAVAYVNKKPKILIIGDSISIGYTPFVKTYFSDVAKVSHNNGNAQHTGTGLQNIEKWLGEDHWDVIQFNWGLWDLCYRHPDSKEFGNRDKINGKPEFSVDEYAANLDSIISIIKSKTKAKLIFVTTTYVPKDEPGRHESDVQKYNDAAKRIMEKHSVVVNDIYDQSVSIHKLYGNGLKDVHYNKKGYEEIGKLIADFLERKMYSIHKN
uniref:SGNH/GDSL hydrolase family protein n=1 Tax=Mariniflexile sp. TaxID=1979402 RepID=UPI004047827F